ncbi:MAG TPA: hypothetical protein PKA88_30890 [Polyangiaceae bacterium]|nr:hypothetical protein [Polyangiaceae bacterium]
MTKRHKARDVAQDRGCGEFWIEHAKITADDLEWLASAERLTLWNVQVPDGFLSKLDKLWWLDLRGGSAANLTAAEGCKKLRYLCVNQVRGMHDLSLVTSFKALQHLSLYGLAKVQAVPSLRGLKELLRLEVGQMRTLEALGGLLDAPKLEELLIHNLVGITDKDVKRINSHRSLRVFDWIALDVPVELSAPVVKAVKLERAKSMHAIEWFESRGL